MDLDVNTDWSLRGLRTVVLENRLLRVVVLPEVGAKIHQITYKPRDADLLWNNPRAAPERLPINSRYDDVWSGGWDELFPNDEATSIDGESYPDHGEVWTGNWRAEPFSAADEVGVRLTHWTPISGIVIEKTLRLRRDQAGIEFQHVMRNPGSAALPFLWKLHPAFAITPEHRLDFPPMKVLLEPAFPGTLTSAPPAFDWPGVATPGGLLDLRRIPPPGSRELVFFYGTELQAGWCALTNTANRLACGLVFDTAVFPSCWLFASHGGWRGHQVAVLEPCTGYPLNFAAMRAAGRARVLAGGGELRTAVKFVVQEGISAVSRIEADGLIVE